ncbi:MAG: response regulator [Bacteroidales bacterium]|nr:response regulator [Bacteroidales bacterium]
MAKVLIVDDLSDNIFLLEELISAFGLEYKSVNNGQEAVNAVIAEDFDIILMDIEMPVMNGFEASEEIRELPEPKKNIPIIAISAHSTDFFDERVNRCGMCDFISKPYSLPKIKEMLKKYGLL